MVTQFSNDSWHFLSFQEHSLRNTRVFYFFLSYENGLVREIVVNQNRSDTIIFKSALHHMFLEICVKAENLSVIFEPRGLDARDGLILRCGSGLLEGKIAKRFGHLIDEIFIDVLLEELLLLLY